MQDAGWHQTPGSWRSSARRLRALEEDLNSLAALVARRPGSGDETSAALTLLDLPGEGWVYTSLTRLVELVLSDNAPGLVDVLDTDEPITPII
jgi:hypothetical protein